MSCDKLGELKISHGSLWSSHFYLTRAVIVAAVNKLESLSVDVEVLNNNQKDLGMCFSQLVKEENYSIGNSLEIALREHIKIAIEIVSNAIAKKDIAQKIEEWKKNGTDIAKIYSFYTNNRINLEKMNNMMQMHLTTTLEEAVAIISGKSKESVKKGNIALEHVISMAEYINSGFSCNCHCCGSCECKS